MSVGSLGPIPPAFPPSPGIQGEEVVASRSRRIARSGVGAGGEVDDIISHNWLRCARGAGSERHFPPFASGGGFHRVEIAVLAENIGKILVDGNRRVLDRVRTSPNLFSRGERDGYYRSWISCREGRDDKLACDRGGRRDGCSTCTKRRTIRPLHLAAGHVDGE